MIIMRHSHDTKKDAMKKNTTKKGVTVKNAMKKKQQRLCYMDDVIAILSDCGFGMNKQRKCGWLDQNSGQMAW